MSPSKKTKSAPPTPLPNTYWVDPGRLLAGEYPGTSSRGDTADRVKRLVEAGVTFFLDLTEKGELKSYESALTSKKVAADRLIEHVRRPIPDHGIPEDAFMRGILDTLKDALSDGHCVYVHCRAGIGRTGTVVACHLIQGGLAPEQALERLQELWKANTRSAHWPYTPETEEQIQFVRRWQSASAPAPATGWNAVSKADTPDIAIPASGQRDRYLGALLGLAVGDALGSTVQNAPAGSFNPLSDLTGGGPFDLPRGAWTDDTAMALCLAESLLESKGADPRDQVMRYGRWQREGYLSSTGQCVGITQTVSRALATAQWSGKPYAGSHDPKRLDKEALTRIAPAVMYFAKDSAEAIEQAAEAARITHQAPGVLDACRYFASLLLAALNGTDKTKLLSAGVLPAVRSSAATRRLAEIAGGAFVGKQEPKIHGGGNVLDAVEAALWALYRSENFRDGALLAANLGGDADVTTALYGQLAGALYGVSAIPRRWRDTLAQSELIEDMAARLLSASAL